MTCIGVPSRSLGNQGACIIAKSYEMKKCGVKTGLAHLGRARQVPRWIFLKRDFRWYEVPEPVDAGDQRATLLDEVEYYSIDEFFFDATPPRGRSHEEYAITIRDRIMDAASLPRDGGDRADADPRQADLRHQRSPSARRP